MLMESRHALKLDFATRALDLRDDVSTTTHALVAGSPVGAPVVSALGTPHTIFPGNVDTMPILNQGDTNGCGTTSLAMIMTHLTGKQFTRESIDADIRRFDVFTSPQHIVDYARDHGLESQGYNHGSAEELRSFIDRGIPVQLIVNAGGSSDVSDIGKLHYVAVVGYYTDPAGNMTGVRVHNSGTGQVEDWDMRGFSSSKWGAAKPGIRPLLHRPRARGTPRCPRGRWEGLEGNQLFALGVANGLNNLDRVIDPDSPGDFVHGFIGLPTLVSRSSSGRWPQADSGASTRPRKRSARSRCCATSCCPSWTCSRVSGRRGRTWPAVVSSPRSTWLRRSAN